MEPEVVDLNTENRQILALKYIHILSPKTVTILHCMAKGS